MRRLWNLFGQLVFYISLPFLNYYLSHTKRVRGLIVAGDTLLLTKTWIGHGKWSLPGGGVHRDETIQQALIREVREETGVGLRESQLMHQFQLNFRQYGQDFSFPSFLVRADARLAVRRQHLEVSAVAWVPIVSLDRRNAAQDVLRALQVLTA